MSTPLHMLMNSLMTPFTPLTTNQPSLLPPTADLKDQVTELRIHRQHDQEKLVQIAAALQQIKWQMLIMALAQVAMFNYLLRG